MDADKLSSYFIAPDLQAQAEGIHDALGCVIPVESVLCEVLTLYGIALHLWFAFYNQKAFPKLSLYPHPLIRATRITIGAADNIDPGTIASSQAMDRARSVLDGLAAAEQVRLHSEGLQQHPFDLADEIVAINTKFAEVERVLDPELREVRLRWGAPGEG